MAQSLEYFIRSDNLFGMKEGTTDNLTLYNYEINTIYDR